MPMVDMEILVVWIRASLASAVHRARGNMSTRRFGTATYVFLTIFTALPLAHSPSKCSRPQSPLPVPQPLSKLPKCNASSSSFLTRLQTTSLCTCPGSPQPGVTSSWYAACGKRVRRVFRWNRVDRLTRYLSRRRGRQGKGEKGNRWNGGRTVCIGTLPASPHPHGKTNTFPSRAETPVTSDPRRRGARADAGFPRV